MRMFRVATTFWNSPRRVKMVREDQIPALVTDLLADINSGLVMSFTIEGE